MKQRTDHQWVHVFKALGNINRLRIVLLLLEHEKRQRTKEGMTVSQLSGKLGITMPSTSRNLRKLSDLNIVQSRGKAGNVFYFLAPELPEDISNVITAMRKSIKRTTG